MMLSQDSECSDSPKHPSQDDGLNNSFYDEYMHCTPNGADQTVNTNQHEIVRPTSIPEESTSTTGKQEAKKVCKSISRLLRDRNSRTRGSRMFQKRRRRSEKFAIVGYGTQPVEEEEGRGSEESDSEKADSDSFFLISTDDEISVYDHPGPNNVLEKDRKLNTSEQIVQNQLRNLAMDAVQMKGKGAKLFAKRQRRMEKFVVGGAAPEDAPLPPVPPNGPIAFVNQAYQPRVQQERESYTPVSFSNIHSTSSAANSVDQVAQQLGRAKVQYSTDDPSAGRARRMRPRDRSPWAGDATRFASADWSSDDEVVHRRQSASSERDERQPQSTQIASGAQTKRNVFRSVLPPTPSAKNQQHPLLSGEVSASATPPFQQMQLAQNGTSASERNASSSLYSKPARKFSAITFQPRKARPSTAQEKNCIQQQFDEQSTLVNAPTVAYPFATNKETLPTSNSSTPLSTWKPSPENSQLKQTPQVTYQPHQNVVKNAPPSPSVSLLKEPLKCASPSPYQRQHVEKLRSPPAVAPVTTYQPAASDVSSTPSSQSYQDTIFNGSNVEETSNTQTTENDVLKAVSPLPKPFLQNTLDVVSIECEAVNLPKSPSSLANGTVSTVPNVSTSQSFVPPPPVYSSYRAPSPMVYPPKPNEPSSADEKPKVMACLKLLDPAKGKYEPKMETVYKSSPSLGAILDEESKATTVKNKSPSRPSFTPQQFNKPVSTKVATPQVSYLKNGNQAKQNEGKPQALGTIAGGAMKGKGARMFEKQQQRMDRYTRECNGSKDARIVPAPLVNMGNQQKPALDPKSRKSMNDVMGEFRKFSDSDSPRRPSGNKKGRGKDPLHYQQYYVARRPPSAADFVNCDDAASDSNNSGTSSMTSSYDKGSTSSSGKASEQQPQPQDEVFIHNDAKMPVKKGPPPRVAPKPDLVRFLSSDSNKSLVVQYENKPCNTAETNQPELPIAQQDPEMSLENAHQINQSKTEDQEGPLKKPAFSVWSPGQRYDPPNIDKYNLPPPPGYKEVMDKSRATTKPVYNARHVHFDTYAPGMGAALSTDAPEETMFDFDPPALQRKVLSLPNKATNVSPAKWSPTGH